MSAYSEVQTDAQFSDGELLCEALQEMGYKPVNCISNPAPLVGYQGDYRTLDGRGHTSNAQEALKAHVIIPRRQVGRVSNDIGFTRGADGKYTPQISDYDSHKHGAEWLNRLRGHYNDKAIQKQAKRAGFRSVSRKVANGKIEYEFVRG